MSEKQTYSNQINKTKQKHLSIFQRGCDLIWHVWKDHSFPELHLYFIVMNINIIEYQCKLIYQLNIIKVLPVVLTLYLI